MTSKIVAGISLVVLTGCSTLPDMPEDSPESIVKLADIIECEIITVFAENAKPGNRDFKNWTASYTITQNITSTNGAAANPVTWIAPAGVDKLLFSADAGVEREAFRNGTAEYSIFVLERESKACARVKTYKNISVDPKDFRLRDWVTQVAPDTQKQLESFSYSVRVQVVSGAGIGTVFEDKKWTATSGLSHSRKSIKTVEFIFSEAPKPPKPTKVIVVAPIPQRPEDIKDKENTPTLMNRSTIRRPAPIRPTGPRIVPDAAVDKNRQIKDTENNLRY